MKNKSIKFSFFILIIATILLFCSCTLKGNVDNTNKEIDYQKTATEYLKAKYDNDFEYITIEYSSSSELTTSDIGSAPNASTNNESAQTIVNLLFRDKNKTLFSVQFKDSVLIGDSYGSVYYTNMVIEKMQNDLADRGVVELVYPEPQNLIDCIDSYTSCKTLDEYLSNNISKKIELNIYTKNMPLKNINKTEVGKIIGTFCTSGSFKVNVLTFSDEKYNEIKHEVLMGNMHKKYDSSTNGYKSSIVFDTDNDKIIKMPFTN